MLILTDEDREARRYGYIDRTSGERIVIGPITSVPKDVLIVMLKPLGKTPAAVSPDSETQPEAITREPRDILDELDEAYRGFGDYLLAKRAADEIRQLRAEVAELKAAAPPPVVKSPLIGGTVSKPMPTTKGD